MQMIRVMLLALLACLLPVQPAAAKQLDGLGELRGTVKAPGKLVSGMVIAYNDEKHVRYVVFTEKNRYHVVNMFPGKYTVTFRKAGYETRTGTIDVPADGRAVLDFAVGATRVEPDYVGGMTYPDARIASYDEIYPPGRGRDIIERTCQGCHTIQLFPYNGVRTYPTGRAIKDRASWAATVDRMHKGPAFGGAGETYFDPKLLPPEDREVLIDYLAANFGPDSEKRVVRKDYEDPPLDEKALGKAQYIEYVFPNTQEYPERFTQQIDFDRDGNVYVTDRGAPGLVVLDPRTAKSETYVGHGGGHGILVDLDKSIWYSGDVTRRFDPATGKRDSYVVDGERRLGANTHIFDSHGDMWLSLLGAGALGKWERKTDTITYWKVPFERSRPYGIVVDHDDKVWFAEYHNSGIASFDPKTQQFRHYRITDFEPTNMRRLGADRQNNIWVSTWGRPNLREGGAIYRLNPDTGAVKEFRIGIPYTNPYDTQADDRDDIWASTDNYLVRLEQKTERITRYPLPVRTDVPKMTHAASGGVWFTARNAGQSGGYGGTASVLYPDKHAMTTLEAKHSPTSPANRLSLYKGPAGPSTEGVIKSFPAGAQNSQAPARPTAPTVVGPTKLERKRNLVVE
jgi:virginiamycin B lyase